MASPDPPPRLGEFIIKVASRCNLACSYCYMYSHGDSTWKRQPKVMAEETFALTLARICEHCLASGQRSVLIVFHGGEPSLIGVDRFKRFCEMARASLGDIVRLDLAIQTNATLLSREWAEAFRTFGVDVGISIDGPTELHDEHRKTHNGRGSFAMVEGGISVLQHAGVPFHILSVIPLGQPPLDVHRFLVSLGPISIAYLLPAHTWQAIGAVREQFGPTPCADFLISVFDEWWENDTVDVRIREFWSIARLIAGGPSQVDAFGNHPLPFVTIETNGEVHGLDKLRICADGLSDSGAHVRDASFEEIVRGADGIVGEVLRGPALPSACVSCPEATTCGGGYLPHRYSAESGFDNPSVWCPDLLRLFTHIRGRLGITTDETLQRRRALATAAAPA